MKWRYLILSLFTFNVCFSPAQEDTNTTNKYKTYIVTENKVSLGSNHLPLNFLKDLLMGVK